MNVSVEKKRKIVNEIVSLRDNILTLFKDQCRGKKRDEESVNSGVA